MSALGVDNAMEEIVRHKGKLTTGFVDTCVAIYKSCEKAFLQEKSPYPIRVYSAPRTNKSYTQVIPLSKMRAERKLLPSSMATQIIRHAHGNSSILCPYHRPEILPPESSSTKIRAGIFSVVGIRSMVIRRARKIFPEPDFFISSVCPRRRTALVSLATFTSMSS